MEVSICQPVETITVDDDVEILPTEIINLSIDSSDDAETDQVSVVSIATTAGESSNCDQTTVSKDSYNEVKDSLDFWDSIKTEDEDVNRYVVPYLQSFAPIKVNNSNNIEIITDEEVVEEHLDSNDESLVASSPRHNMGSLHVCPECNFEASERPSYLQHLKDVHGILLHECPYCPSRYLHEEFLLSHVRQIHFQLSKLKCCSCEGSYDNYTQLRTHLTKYHDCRRAQLIENVDFEYFQDNVRESDDQSGEKIGGGDKRHLKRVPASSIKLGNASIRGDVIKHTDMLKTVSIKDRKVSEDSKKMFRNVLSHMFPLDKSSDCEKTYENINDLSENVQRSSGSTFANTEHDKKVGKDARLKIHKHDAATVNECSQSSWRESRVTSSDQIRGSGYPKATTKVTNRLEASAMEMSLRTGSAVPQKVKYKCAKAKHIDNTMETVQPDLEKTTDVKMDKKQRSASLEARQVDNVQKSVQPSLEDTSLTANAIVEERKTRCSKAKQVVQETMQPSLEKISALVEKSKSRCAKVNLISNPKKNNTEASLEDSLTSNSAVIENIKPGSAKANLVGHVMKNTEPILKESVRFNSAVVEKVKSGSEKANQVGDIKKNTEPSLDKSVSNSSVIQTVIPGSRQANFGDNVKKRTEPNLEESASSNSAVVEKIKPGSKKLNQVGNIKKNIESSLDKSIRSNSAVIETVKPGSREGNFADNVKKSTRVPSLEESVRSDSAAVEKIKSRSEKANQICNAKKNSEPNMDKSISSNSAVVEKIKSGSGKIKQAGTVKETTQPNLEKISTCRAVPDQSKPESAKTNPVSNPKKNTEPSLDKSVRFNSAVVEKIKPESGKANQVGNLTKNSEPSLDKSLSCNSEVVGKIKPACEQIKQADKVKEITQPNPEEISTCSTVSVNPKPGSAKTNPVGNLKKNTEPSSKESVNSNSAVVEKIKSDCVKTKAVVNVKQTTPTNMQKISSDNGLVEKSKPEPAKTDPVFNVKKNTRSSVEESSKFDSGVVKRSKSRSGKTKRVTDMEEPSPVKTSTDRKSVPSATKRSAQGKMKQLDDMKEKPTREETNVTTDGTLTDATKSAFTKAADTRQRTRLNREEIALSNNNILLEKTRSERLKPNRVDITQSKAEDTKKKRTPARVKRHFCYVCGLVFMRDNEVVTHTRSKHVDYEMLQCVHCDSTFGYFWALKRHMRSHHGMIQLTHYKDFKFVPKISHPSPRKAKAPSKDRNPPEVASYNTRKPSSSTNKNVKDGVVLAKMDLARCESNSTIFSCGKCKFATRRKEQLKNHIINTHKSRVLHKCSYCEKSYVTTAELTSHLQQFHKYSESFLCLGCGRKFKYMKILKEHVRDRHGNTAVLSPDVDYKVIEEMSNSVDVTDHKQRRKFRCVRCGFKSNKHQMRAHIKIHRPINILKKANHSKSLNMCQSPNDHSSQRNMVDLLRINRKIQRRNSAIRAGTLECEKRTVFVAKPFGSLKDESCRNDALGVLTTPSRTDDIVSEIVEVPEIVESPQSVSDFQVASGKIMVGDVTRTGNVAVTELSVPPVKSKQPGKIAVKSGVPEKQDIEDVIVNASQKSTAEKDLKEPTSFCVETSVNKKRKFNDEVKPATSKRVKVENVMYIASNKPDKKPTLTKSTLLLNQTVKTEHAESPSASMPYTDSIDMVNSKILDIQNLESKGVDKTTNTSSQHVITTDEIEKRINSLQNVTTNTDDIETIADPQTEPENTKESALRKTKVQETSQEECDDDVIILSDSDVNEESTEIEQNGDQKRDEIAVNIDASLEDLKYAKEKNISADISRDATPVSSGGNATEQNDKFGAHEVTFKDSVHHTEEELSSINSNEAIKDMGNDDDIIFVNTYIENERNINNIEILDENSSPEHSPMTDCDNAEYMYVCEDMDVEEGIELEKHHNNSVDVVANESATIVDILDETKHINRSPCYLIDKFEDTLQTNIDNENVNNGNNTTPANQKQEHQDGSELTVSNNISKISKSKLIRVLSDVSLTTTKSADVNYPISKCYCEDFHNPKTTLNAENDSTIGTPSTLNDHNNQLDCGTTEYQVIAAENVSNRKSDSLSDCKVKNKNQKRTNEEATDMFFSNADVEAQIRKLKYIKISSTNNILENECYAMGNASMGETSHHNDPTLKLTQLHNATSEVLGATEVIEASNASLRNSTERNESFEGPQPPQLILETPQPPQLILEGPQPSQSTQPTCNDVDLPILHKPVRCPRCEMAFPTHTECFTHIKKWHKRKPKSGCNVCHSRHANNRCLVCQVHHDTDLGCRYCGTQCDDLLALRHHLTFAHRDQVGADVLEPEKEGTKTKSTVLETDVLFYEQMNLRTPALGTLQRIGTLYRQDGLLRIREVEKEYAEYEQAQVSSEVMRMMIDSNSRSSRSKGDVGNIGRSKHRCGGEDAVEKHGEMRSDRLVANGIVCETLPVKMASELTTSDFSLMPDQLNTRASVGRRKKAKARKLIIMQI